jgi:hypothetical protein
VLPQCDCPNYIENPITWAENCLVMWGFHAKSGDRGLGSTG